MNIEKHDFSSSELFALVYKGEYVYIYDETNDSVIPLNKQDVIALAKHFNLLEDK